MRSRGANAGGKRIRLSNQINLYLGNYPSGPRSGRAAREKLLPSNSHISGFNFRSRRTTQSGHTDICTLRRERRVSKTCFLDANRQQPLVFANQVIGAACCTLRLLAYPRATLCGRPCVPTDSTPAEFICMHLAVVHGRGVAPSNVTAPSASPVTLLHNLTLKIALR